MYLISYKPYDLQLIAWEAGDLFTSVSFFRFRRSGFPYFWATIIDLKSGS